VVEGATEPARRLALYQDTCGAPNGELVVVRWTSFDKSQRLFILLALPFQTTYILRGFSYISARR